MSATVNPVETAASTEAAKMTANPAAEFNTGLAAGSPPLYNNRTHTFKFKKSKKDENNPLAPDVPQRAPVTVVFPVPTWEGLKQFTNNPDATIAAKNQAWILDIISDTVRDAVKDQVTDASNPVNNQNGLDLKVLTLDYLANLPPAERGARAIPAEVWEEWAKDYSEVITAQGTSSPDKVAAQTDALRKKFTPVRTSKEIVEFLKNQLNVWANNSQNFEDYIVIYESLKKKAEDILAADAQVAMNNFV